MKRNTDPERARKRAKTDLRCAAKKMGLGEACRVLLELAGEQAGIDPDYLMPGNHSVICGIGRMELAGLIIAGQAKSRSEIDWEAA